MTHAQYLLLVFSLCFLLPLPLSIKLLDQGCDTYHQSVLWIVNDFLIKLEENSTVDMGLVTETITKPVSHFIKVLLQYM